MADFIRTPYYRQPYLVQSGGPHLQLDPIEIPLIDSELKPAYDQEFDSNYTPYQLHVLRTNLDPLLAKYYNSAQTGQYYFVRFDRRMLDSKYTVVVTVHDGLNQVKLSEPDRLFLKQAVDDILETRHNLTLLFSNQTFFTTNSLVKQELDNRETKKIIPNSWIMKISKHIVFDKTLRAHYRPDDEFTVGGIYANLSGAVDYNKVYANLNFNIMRNINYMYKRGFVSLPTELIDDEQLLKWGVRSLNESDIDIKNHNNLLFSPAWKDTRLTGPVGGVVEFIQKHVIQKSNKVLLDLGSESAAVRHQVSRAFQSTFGLEEYIFKGRWVEVLADNINIAQKAASLINMSRNIPASNIITINSADKLHVESYIYLFHKSSNNVPGVHIAGYITNDDYNKYCLSCQIPVNSNHNYYLNKIEEWYTEAFITIGLEMNRTLEDMQKARISSRLTQKVIETFQTAEQAKIPLIPYPEFAALTNNILGLPFTPQMLPVSIAA